VQQAAAFRHCYVTDGNRVIEEELVPFAVSRMSGGDDFDDLLQIARERLSQR